MTSEQPRSRAANAALLCAALLSAGVAWLATAYLTLAAFPVPGIGNANVVVGYLLLGLGLVAGVVAIVRAIVGAVNRRRSLPRERPAAPVVVS